MTYLTIPFVFVISQAVGIEIPVVVADVIGMYLILMKEKFEPRTFVMWALIILVLPIIGFILYLMFGYTLHSRKLFKRKMEHDEGVFGHCADGGSGIRIYDGNDDFMKDLEEDLASAGSVGVECYSLSSSMPDGVVDLLSTCKTDAEIRVLTTVNGFGRNRGVGRIKKRGGVHRTFNNILYSTLMHKHKGRNYRSMIVLDDDVAYIPGVARVSGPGASNMKIRFAMDWSYASGEDIEVRNAGPVAGGTVTDVVSGGPDCSPHSVENIFVDIISSSRDRLYVSQSHLVPDDILYNLLKSASLFGTDVRIMLPSKPRFPHQRYNNRYVANALHRSGVRVFFSDRIPPAGLLVSDGYRCSIGSASFSSMSMNMDFNTGIVVESEDVAARAESLLDWNDATEYNDEEYEHRTLLQRLLTSASRMLMFLN